MQAFRTELRARYSTIAGLEPSLSLESFFWEIAANNQCLDMFGILVAVTGEKDPAPRIPNYCRVLISNS